MRGPTTVAGWPEAMLAGHATAMASLKLLPER